MTQEGQIPPPPVVWAQRRHVLYVTICLEDCKDPVIEIKPESIHFKGVGGTEQKMHEVTINLYKEIDPDKTVQNPKGRTFELILTKKTEGPYWPRLTKENTKAHWLKSDFNKWKDEDDSDDELDMRQNAPDDMDSSNPELYKMLKMMVGSNGPGDSKPDFDDIGDDAGGVDSDDEEMPDLE